MAASTPDGERGIVIILTAVMALGTCTQFVLGALAPRVSTELGLSAASFGLLVTGLFGCGLLIAPTAGRVVDRWGTAHALAGVCSSTGIAMVALALVVCLGFSRWLLAG
jgi:predicted MFS family arabinose efflux permease